MVTAAVFRKLMGPLIPEVSGPRWATRCCNLPGRYAASPRHTSRQECTDAAALKATIGAFGAAGFPVWLSLDASLSASSPSLAAADGAAAALKDVYDAVARACVGAGAQCSSSHPSFASTYDCWASSTCSAGKAPPNQIVLPMLLWTLARALPALRARLAARAGLRRVGVRVAHHRRLGAAVVPIHQEPVGGDHSFPGRFRPLRNGLQTCCEVHGEIEQPELGSGVGIEPV